MVAHLDSGSGCISGLVHMCQNANIGTGRLVVRIPLVILNHKRSVDAFHYRMFLVFHNHCAISKRSDIVLEANAAHEIGEPLPQRVTVKVSQQSSMMETNPTATTFVNVVDEVLLCFLRPGIRREVQLND